MLSLRNKAIEERRQADEQKHKAGERKFWTSQKRISWVNLVFSFFTFCIAVVGAFIAYFAFQASNQSVGEAKRQANAAEDQNKASRIAIQQQLRAYVFLHQVQIDLNGRMLKGTLLLKNFGQTPAYDF